MLTVAYLANRFPCEVEPYVGDEIEELRTRGVRVIAGSVRKPAKEESPAAPSSPEIRLWPVCLSVLMQAAWLCSRRWNRISDLILRVAFRGGEGTLQRVKALLHTWLGACYAVLLEGRQVDHIHVHHGYFGSWIAMVAARLLDIDFSMTLHGSDLLLRAAYLDVKLEHCKFCLTVSEYNRRYTLDHYPQVQSEKVVVSRLGVNVREPGSGLETRHRARNRNLVLVAVGRLHAVKDHAFLVRAISQLKAHGVDCECSIAGEGPERRHLESLIWKLGLEERVTLLGHVPREQMDSLYDRADVVVLTSRSEGIPLVLMEAMARGKIVLAPAITGIPELVIAGQTGFLYEAGSMGDFVSRLLFIHSLMQTPGGRDQPRPERHTPILSAARQLDWVRHAAWVQVAHTFNRSKSLQSFGDLFIQRIAPQTESPSNESFVLQQIQLSVQRHRGVPVRVDGVDAVAGTRSSSVLDG
jgi:glycosyltransferase involved in cell wall biosynthesis